MTSATSSSMPEALPSTSRAQAKARTRKRLLDAARSLFMERGYEAATIRDIAAHAGLSTGAVFASFADKAELFDAVMAQDLDTQIRITQEALARTASTEESLLYLLTRAYELHLTQLPLLQAALSLSWSQGLSGPFGQRPVYGKAMEVMLSMLQRGVANGELPASANLELVAEMTWDAYLSNYRRAAFDGWAIDALVARLTDQIRLLLAGARASASPA